jgi:anthranilate phosphoribosyltransferase
MWKSFLERLENGLNLETHEISSIMETILRGEAEVAEIKSFLFALKNKGETAEEVSALVNQMFAHSAPISISDRAVDTVGTGGDGAHTINISTTAAIIAASAGARVVKHGNRAASSKSGSGDLLEALGVAITLDGKGVERTVSELGIGLAWASILAMPYAILAGSLPAEKMGVYMGIFNFFIVIPQITAAAILGFFVKNIVGGEAIYALLLGGASMIIAGLFTLIVDDVD